MIDDFFPALVGFSRFSTIFLSTVKILNIGTCMSEQTV